MDEDDIRGAAKGHGFAVGCVEGLCRERFRGFRRLWYRRFAAMSIYAACRLTPSGSLRSPPTPWTGVGKDVTC